MELNEKELPQDEPKTEAPKASKTDVYKLNLRRSNGQLRTDIPKGLLFDVMKSWGDLVKAIPSHRWSTLEELVQFVWDQEKRNYLRQFSRTRKQIEDGIGELVKAGIVLIK